MKLNDISIDLPDRDAQYVATLAKSTGGLGKQAAEIAGVLEDLERLTASETQTFADLRQRLSEVEQSQEEILSQADHAVRESEAAQQGIHAALERTRSLAEAAAQVEEGVLAVADVLKRVSSVAADIEKVALQTRLVAFNATVEAARAGVAGRGFAVVAQAIKDLAESARAASQDISGTVKALDRQVEFLSGSTSRASARDAEEAVSAAQATADGAFGRLRETLGQVSAQARHGATLGHAVSDGIEKLTTEVQSTAAAIQGASQNAASLLTVSEELIDAAVASGFETEDSPFIRALLKAKADVEAAFADGLANGQITRDALMDREYSLVPGSNPQQFTTRYLKFVDDCLPAIQEPMLALSDKIVLCAAVDNQAYLPTHNRKFSKPQGPDPVWNTANCRNRRIFNDRTGLAAARNQKPFLLQTYRRDMGGGKFVLMKDLSAPIYVEGAHWGALRLAYRFE